MSDKIYLSQEVLDQIAEDIRNYKPRYVKKLDDFPVAGKPIEGLIEAEFSDEEIAAHAKRVSNAYDELAILEDTRRDLPENINTPFMEV